MSDTPNEEVVKFGSGGKEVAQDYGGMEKRKHRVMGKRKESTRKGNFQCARKEH